MDDATRKMIVSVGAGLARKVLMLQAGALVSHGIINSNQTEMFVSIGLALVGAGWSFWNDYGRAIVLSQLEVLKAKSLAQASKMRDAGVSPVTVNQIAAASPTMTAADVTKAITKLPEANQAVVQPAITPVILLAVMLSGLFAFSGDARAQGIKLKPLTGDVAQDLGIRKLGGGGGLTGAVVTDMQNFFNAKLLPDLQYSLKLAQASKNDITAVCYQAWIDIITTQQTAVKNADGTDIAMPDPHIITEFEKLVELRNALQPESMFMRSCSPVASMVKKDIAGFIGLVISGGAGLATLVPGL